MLKVKAQDFRYWCLAYREAVDLKTMGSSERLQKKKYFITKYYVCTSNGFAPIELKFEVLIPFCQNIGSILTNLAAKSDWGRGREKQENRSSC